MTHIPLLVVVLALFQCFGRVTLGPTTTSKTMPNASTAGDIHVMLDPYAGLPTKFGDEDDVIHLKQAPLLVVPPPPVAKASTTAHHAKKAPAIAYEPADDFYDEEDYAVEEGEVSKEAEHEDEDDDEYGTSKQTTGGSGGHEDAEIGASLDTFGTTLDGVGKTGDEAPMFLSEPQSAFIVRGRAAVLKCKAAHAIQLTFKCSGSSQPPPSTMDTHVNPRTGVHVHEVTAIISKDLVFEYFGKGPFRCECVAWSPRGTVRSQPAIIEVAYLKKQFSLQPQSQRVELGGRVELRCGLPSGMPLPTLHWLKNGAPIQEHQPSEQQQASQADTSMSSSSGSAALVTADGNVLIQRATLHDMANYTCVAENVSGKRMSEPVVVTVIVNGGWGAWSAWTECRCPGRSPVGQKQTRNCVNPAPLNGGLSCSGPAIRRTPDCVQCTDEFQIVNAEAYDWFKGGRWSAWSEWSTCTSECIRIRRRACLASADATSQTAAAYGGGDASGHLVADKTACSGRDIQTDECRGGNCSLGGNGINNNTGFKWTLYIGLTMVGAVCVALGALIARGYRKGCTKPFGDDQNDVQPGYPCRGDLKSLRFQHGGGGGGSVGGGTLGSQHQQQQQQHCNITTNYEYPSLHYHSLVPSGAGSMISQKTGRPLSEHHYDVPQMAVHNFRPLVGLGSSSSNSYSSSDYSKRTSSPDSVMATPSKTYTNAYSSGYT